MFVRSLHMTRAMRAAEFLSIWEREVIRLRPDLTGRIPREDWQSAEYVAREEREGPIDYARTYVARLALAARPVAP